MALWDAVDSEIRLSKPEDDTQQVLAGNAATPAGQ